MTSKAAKKKMTKPSNDANVLVVQSEKGKTWERQKAEIGMSAVGANAQTTKAFVTGFAGELDITEAVAVLELKAARVQKGDLSEVEATLAAQAVALDAIFNGLAKRAALNMGQYIGACDTYLRLALKAQSQCRATLETLAEIKYPKHPTFVGQQNVAYQQQVNNCSSTDDSATSTHMPAHGKNISDQNKLLVGQNDDSKEVQVKDSLG